MRGLLGFVEFVETILLVDWPSRRAYKYRQPTVRHLMRPCKYDNPQYATSCVLANITTRRGSRIQKGGFIQEFRLENRSYPDVHVLVFIAHASDYC